MSFSPPKELRDIVLYIWKILDNPQILKDTLHNFIAFDLNLLNLAKTKQFLNQAIDKGYLIEDESLEYVV